jgi:peptidoglycan/LPS O-acetylase OafA/YrhL
MNSSRPNSVKMAICCLAVSFAISLVQRLLNADFKTNGFAYCIFGFLIALFLVFMIYRRKNWARWIYAGCVVIWLVTLVVHLRFLTGLSIIGGVLLAVQLALWLAAAFMLFVPETNDWFRKKKVGLTSRRSQLM